MSIRPDLWRRVHARRAYLGLSVTELLERLYGPTWGPTQRADLTRRLRRAPTEGLAKALDIDVTALAADASTAALIECAPLAARSELWRRAHMRAAWLGWTTPDVRSALHPAGWGAAERSALTRLLTGRRSDRPKWSEPLGARKALAKALGVPAGALADGGPWLRLLWAPTTPMRRGRR